MSNQLSDKELASRIYDLDTKVYEATGSTLGKTLPAEKKISVNQLIRLMKTDKNRILKQEMILISNMLKTLEDEDCYDALVAEYLEIEEALKQFDPQSYYLTSALEIIDRTARPFPADKKLIICINRQYGCRGQEAGILLAKRTGLPYYDKDILTQACEKYNISSVGYADINTYISSAGSPSTGYKLPKVGSMPHDKIYFAQRKVIQEIAESQSCIFLGRCADHVLEQLMIPHISIFLCAPLEERIKTEMARNHVDAQQAKKNVLMLDKHRTSFYKFYTGKVWGTPSLYNACINTAFYGVEGSVDLIMNMIEMRISQDA